jgi:hypothetical protein
MICFRSMETFLAACDWAIYIVFFVSCPATLFFIFRRKLYTRLIFFTAFQILLLAWAILWTWVSGTPAFTSHLWFNIYWGVQSAMSILKLFTIGEISNRVLHEYPAIRVLASGLLGGTAAILLLWTADSAIHNAHHIRRFILLGNQRFELMLAVLILVLLMIGAYYRIQILPLYRLILIGIGIYSAIQVANNELAIHILIIPNSIFDYMRRGPSTISNVIWAYAVWRCSPAPDAKPALISQATYDDLSPQIHDRLKELNDKLSGLTAKRRR